MNDLIQQLRDRAYSGKSVDTLCERAAAEIERLNREVSVLVAECQNQKDLLVNGDAALRNGVSEGCETAPLWGNSSGYTSGISEANETKCPYVTGTVTRYCTLTPLTLTDAERSAIADAADRYAEITPESRETDATLRGLLERMK